MTVFGPLDCKISLQATFWFEQWHPLKSVSWKFEMATAGPKRFQFFRNSEPLKKAHICPNIEKTLAQMEKKWQNGSKKHLDKPKRNLPFCEKNLLIQTPSNWGPNIFGSKNDTVWGRSIKLWYYPSLETYEHQIEWKWSNTRHFKIFQFFFAIKIWCVEPSKMSTFH